MLKLGVTDMAFNNHDIVFLLPAVGETDLVHSEKRVATTTILVSLYMSYVTITNCQRSYMYCWWSLPDPDVTLYVTGAAIQYMWLVQQ